MGKEDLEAVAQFAIKHDLIVISDEIYSELTYDADHHSIGALPNMKERTIVLNGFSKFFPFPADRFLMLLKLPFVP